MRLSMRQLEALSSVAEQGSMTRAAADLGISQPAVSRLLADLSTQLGFELFERRDGRLVPTQEARFLLPDINRLIERLDHLGEVSRNLTDRKAGHLRVACLPGFATSHLPAVLADFLANRPGVTVTVEPDRPERIMEWIIGEQYDCGITDGFEGHPAVHSEIVEIRSVCILPRGHPLTNRAVLRPRDLYGQKIIHTRRDSPFFRELNDAFAQEGVSLKSRIETRQFTAACELVALGLGVAVISQLDAAGYVDRGIVWRPFVPSIPHRLALVRPIHKHPSMITLEFMEIFRASLTGFEGNDRKRF
ncbi:MAG: LysR family transcriptional regulator [Rhodobacteraceae bacterium]|nr:LysR family transcriptional regulator [Paracoccaceae bacterium]